MNRGFTLIETLVAISILAITLVGPFVAVQNAVTSSYAARDQLVATSLAQEGMEYVRSIRDGNYLYRVQNPTATLSWLYGLDGTGGSVNCVDSNSNDTTPLNCVVDPTGNAPTAQCAANGTGACPPLTLSPSTHLYTQSAAYPATRFTRTVTLSNVNATEVKVTVTVTWTTAHKPYVVTVSENLKNWL